VYVTEGVTVNGVVYWLWCIIGDYCVCCCQWSVEVLFGLEVGCSVCVHGLKILDKLAGMWCMLSVDVIVGCHDVVVYWSMAENRGRRLLCCAVD